MVVVMECLLTWGISHLVNVMCFVEGEGYILGISTRLDYTMHTSTGK